jgi:hypothetical protein
MTYARRTRVPVNQSRNEIEKTLVRYGASGFIYGYDKESAIVGFRMSERHVKFMLPMKKGMNEQQERQRWRALLLVIKAKLEAVSAGITVFDDEFMAHIVTPDGTTLGEQLRPQIESMYKTGKMPPLLPYHGAT